MQLISQLTAERVGLLRDQLAEQLLLLLLVELRDMTAGMRTGTDQTFLAITLPDASRRCRRAGHNLSHVVAL